MPSAPNASAGPAAGGLDLGRLLGYRARAIDASGIRKVFDLAAKLKDPINLSIGQPDFPVPERMKQAAIDAIAALIASRFGES